MHSRPVPSASLATAAILFAIVAALGSALPARAQDPCRSAAIQVPGPGTVISGTVAILGSARMDNFNFYKLEWASESRPDSWSAVSTTVAKQVSGGVLDRWNTAPMPDGSYRLKLTLVDQQGQEICRRTVSSLQVANLSLPSPEASPSAEDPADPTALARDGSPAPATGTAELDDEAEDGTATATEVPEAGAAPADTSAPEGDASEAVATDTPPVDIAPAPAPSTGGFLPTFRELFFCFGGTFLATLALAVWLWRRRDEWTG